MFQIEFCLNFFFFYSETMAAFFHHYIMNKVIRVEKHSLELNDWVFATFNICFAVIDMF